MPTALEQPNAIDPYADALPDDALYEFIDGKLVEKKMGALACRLATRISSLMDHYAVDRKLGQVIGEATFKCFAHDPGKIRRPDVAFIRVGRFKKEILPEGHIHIAPDIAIEVVSPNETAQELRDKVYDYLRAGTPCVWVVYPHSKSIVVHRKNGVYNEICDDGELSGEDVLPGFSCKLSAIFPAE